MAAEPDEDQARQLGERLAQHFRGVYVGSMADAPICNPALDVAAIGFGVLADKAIGVVTTPWFMNVVAVPLPGAPNIKGASGETAALLLPAGKVDFLVGDLDGLGRILMCSLFSPMGEFVDQAAAVATAEAALAALLDPQTLAGDDDAEIYPQAPALTTDAAQAPTQFDRRALLRGRLTAPREDGPRP